MSDMTRRSFMAGCAAAGFLGVRANAAAGAHDPNLMVFLSDIHMHDPSKRWKNGPTHQNRLLARYVGEILGLRPLPAHAVVFGDFSASCGWLEDFELAASLLKPLADAGIQLTLGMGNHDNRANFMKAFPDYEKRLLVPGRIVSKVSTPNADLVMLDTLKSHPGEDWAPATSKGSCVEGAMDDAQRAWLRETLAAAKRPTFLGAHHPAGEAGIEGDIVSAPAACGYIFGHWHRWNESFLHHGYRNSQIVQAATLPSGGYYGDVGYALFRTHADRAELTLCQRDFFFNREWPGKPRPKQWEERIRMHRDAKVVFWYEKPANFYKG